MLSFITSRVMKSLYMIINVSITQQSLNLSTKMSDCIPKQSAIVQSVLSYPFEIILYHLSYTEVIKKSRISRDVNEYCNDDGFWKRYAHYVYGVERCAVSTWKETVRIIDDILQQYSAACDVVHLDTIKLLFNNFAFDGINIILRAMGLCGIIDGDHMEDYLYLDSSAESSGESAVLYREVLALRESPPTIESRLSFAEYAEGYILAPTRYYIQNEFRSVTFNTDRLQTLARTLDIDTPEGIELAQVLNKIYKNNKHKLCM